MSCPEQKPGHHIKCTIDRLPMSHTINKSNCVAYIDLKLAAANTINNDGGKTL